ncbi:MAG: hypothetical protein ACR2JQ_12225 [Mycobacteriales bacterium]
MSARRGWLRTGVAASAVIAASIIAATATGTASSAAADGGGPLRLISVDRSGAPRIRAVAVTPPMLSELALPASAFTAAQPSGPVALSATRAINGHLQVVLAIDLDVPAAAFTAEQTAIVELVHTLPATLPISLASDPAAGPATGGEVARASLLASVGALKPSTSAQSVVELTANTVLAPPATGRRVVVMFSGCGALGDSTGVDQLRTGLGLYSQQLDLVRTAPRCRAGSALDGAATTVLSLATGNAGSLATGNAGSTAESISREITGEYLLSLSVPAGSTAPVTLTVRQAEVTATQTLRLSGASTPAATTHGLPTRWLVVGVVAGLVLLALIGLGALLRRRRAAW